MVGVIVSGRNDLRFDNTKFCAESRTELKELLEKLKEKVRNLACQSTKVKRRS